MQISVTCLPVSLILSHVFRFRLLPDFGRRCLSTQVRECSDPDGRTVVGDPEIDGISPFPQESRCVGPEDQQRLKEANIYEEDSKENVRKGRGETGVPGLA